MRSLDAYLADNISSNDLIDDQLWHGIFLQIIPFVTNFNMDYSFMNLVHLRQTSQKSFQEGCPMRSVAA